MKTTAFLLAVLLGSAGLAGAQSLSIGPNGVSFSALRPTVTGARNLALGEPAGDDHDSHH